MILKRPNGKWRVKVKFRGVIVADRTFERRGDAVRWEMEQKRLLQSGEFVSPAAGRITVAELAEEYCRSREGQISVRAWESDESALRVHIVPEFRHKPISSVTSVEVERFLTYLALSRSVRTAARTGQPCAGCSGMPCARAGWRSHLPRTCRCHAPTPGRARSSRSTLSRSECWPRWWTPSEGTRPSMRTSPWCWR